MTIIIIIMFWLKKLVCSCHPPIPTTPLALCQRLAQSQNHIFIFIIVIFNLNVFVIKIIIIVTLVHQNSEYGHHFGIDNFNISLYYKVLVEGWFDLKVLLQSHMYVFLEQSRHYILTFSIKKQFSQRFLFLKWKTLLDFQSRGYQILLKSPQKAVI